MAIFCAKLGKTHEKAPRHDRKSDAGGESLKLLGAMGTVTVP